MAAFIEVSEQQLINFLVMFGLGELVSFEPTPLGIDNSNFFVTLDQNGQEMEYVLTLLESVDFSEVSFFNHLVSHLHSYGLPVAAPQRTLDGMNYTIFRGKPAVLTKRLPGEHLSLIDPRHCQQIGVALGEMHQALETFKLGRESLYDSVWLRDTGPSLVGDEDKGLLELGLSAIEKLSQEGAALRKGIIHGDLFADNTLFQADKLTAILDFYRAGLDWTIVDLAIAANDWCWEEDHHNSDKLAQLLTGYESERPLTAVEKQLWPEACQIGAMRFWLSRLTITLHGDHLKDPSEFKQRLEHLRTCPPLNG